MRFNILLSVDRKKWGASIPLSYQYELSSYIYGTLAKGDSAYAEWLHENGFMSGQKKFKLFVFSPLLIEKRTVDTKSNRLVLLQDTASFLISFFPERSTEEFVKGIFQEQEFTLGDRKSKVQFAVRGIEMLPSPVFDGELVGETLSSICLSRRNEEGKVHYFSVSEAEAGNAILNNLLNKYQAFYNTPFNGDPAFEWEVLNKPRTKLITIKSGTPQQTFVQGSLCKFRLKADNELLKVAYESGVGEKGSLGFGMVERK